MNIDNKSLLACLHVANMESKGQGHSALTRYARNVLVYNHILYITGKKKKKNIAHFGRVCEILDSEIRKGIPKFIIIAAESSEKLLLVFPKPKSSCRLEA